MAVQHPAWAQRCAIYQVNVRQYTPQGTLAAFEPHLDRIADLMGGQGIIWFMPIQPIGAEQRKGGMGSYYSVRDYTAVNPEFGTLDDFRRVVDRAHALGLRVILDWVANHTAWDHIWTQQHPQWYLQDAQGRIHSYVYRADPHDPNCVPEYWTDVVGLDWSQPAVAEAMQAAMLWWMDQTGLDGFRCDVAALVPIDFWERMRPLLDARRADRGGVFMLAEAHEPIHHRAAFDATYDWELHNRFKAMAAGRLDGSALREWWQARQEHYGPGDWRLLYTANHDSNSWQGSCAELFGSLAAFKAYAVLAALLPGQPLIYGGQEGFFEKRLAFFEKDAIEWRDRPLHDFYRELLALRREHPALAHDTTLGEFQWLESGHPRVVGFRRTQAGRSLQVWVNLSDEAVVVPGLEPRPSSGPLAESSSAPLALKAFEFRWF